MISTYLVPVCPTCNHSYDDVDFEKAECDLYSIAKNEETVHIKCPECKTGFWVEGSYTPQYRSAVDAQHLSSPAGREKTMDVIKTEDRKQIPVDAISRRCQQVSR